MYKTNLSSRPLIFKWTACFCVIVTTKLLTPVSWQSIAAIIPGRNETNIQHICFLVGSREKWILSVWRVVNNQLGGWRFMDADSWRLVNTDVRDSMIFTDFSPCLLLAVWNSIRFLFFDFSTWTFPKTSGSHILFSTLTNQCPITITGGMFIKIPTATCMSTFTGPLCSQFACFHPQLSFYVCWEWRTPHSVRW